jgi:hypothetical protein
MESDCELLFTMAAEPCYTRVGAGGGAGRGGWKRLATHGWVRAVGLGVVGGSAKRAWSHMQHTSSYTTGGATTVGWPRGHSPAAARATPTAPAEPIKSHTKASTAGVRVKLNRCSRWGLRPWAARWERHRAHRGSVWVSTRRSLGAGASASGRTDIAVVVVVVVLEVVTPVLGAAVAAALAAATSASQLGESMYAIASTAAGACVIASWMST